MMRNRIGPPSLKPDVKLRIGAAANVSACRMNEDAAPEDQDCQCQVRQKRTSGLKAEELHDRSYVSYADTPNHSRAPAGRVSRSRLLRASSSPICPAKPARSSPARSNVITIIAGLRGTEADENGTG